MTWRKSWAKNWDDVLYCSDACRRQRKASEREGTESTATQPKVTGR